MKTLIALFTFISFVCVSQNYDTTKHYLNQGTSPIICDPTTYELTDVNSYGSLVIVGYYQKCKVLTWEQEFYEGTIYMWFDNKFKEIKNASGKFWKARWEDAKIKI